MTSPQRPLKGGTKIDVIGITGSQKIRMMSFMNGRLTNLINEGISYIGELGKKSFKSILWPKLLAVCVCQSNKFHFRPHTYQVSDLRAFLKYLDNC